MKRCLSLLLIAFAALLTGCPHNEYEVELKPRGNVIERKLSLNRVDDNGTNGAPKQQAPADDDITAIKKLYPSGSAGMEGERFVATGLFSNSMPADIGGAGTYTNLATSLGSAGFYLERFRGDNDLTAMTQKRYQAADQITDLLVGWANAELGKEKNFADLRRFLDVDFRHDLKNAGDHVQALVQLDGNLKTFLSEAETNGLAMDINSQQVMRIGQYFVEHGYLTVDELASIMFESYAGALGPRPLLQRLIASKLGVLATDKIPKSLAFLDNDDSIQASFEKYLKTTEFYRTKLRDWEKNQVQGSTTDAPKPTDFASELAFTAVGVQINLFGSDNRLSVKLSLPSAPVRSNGKWDEAQKAVVWASDLPERDNKAGLPVLCYACWSEPDDVFQKKHFGSTCLVGEELLRYCLWRSGLNPGQSAEWDKLVAGLQPDKESKNRLETFRFSDESTPASTPGQPTESAMVMGATLIKAAMEAKTD